VRRDSCWTSDFWIARERREAGSRRYIAINGSSLFERQSDSVSVHREPLAIKVFTAVLPFVPLLLMAASAQAKIVTKAVPYEQDGVKFSGADLAGVVTFHGGLTAPKDDDKKRIKTKILALHGADDPLVPPDQVKAWEDGMRAAGVDWELIAYGGAVHTFSNPAAGSANKAQGVAYDAKAANRSWQHVQLFFCEILGESGKKIAAAR
jgi:acetyl esterase/lipase